MIHSLTAPSPVPPCPLPRRPSELSSYMRVDRQSLTDLLSLRDAALILSTLHRRQVVFPVPPTPHAVALVLRHLWANRHVTLPPCGPRGVKSVATLSSPLSSTLIGKPRRAALVRLWGQLAKRVVAANEGCSVLFCHVCVAAVVLLQDVIPTTTHDTPLAFRVRHPDMPRTELV